MMTVRNLAWYNFSTMVDTPTIETYPPPDRVYDACIRRTRRERNSLGAYERRLVHSSDSYQAQGEGGKV